MRGALSAGATDAQTLANWLMEQPAQVDHVAAAGARRDGEPQKAGDVMWIEDDTPKDKEGDARLSFPVSHSVTLPPPPPSVAVRIDAAAPPFSQNLIYNTLSRSPLAQQGGSGTQTFDRMLLKLITAVTNNARKKDVVDILTEAREQGINNKDLLNGLSKRDVPEGRTPLAYAAKMNLHAMADHLLDLGASPNQRMDDNITALSLAATNDRWDGTEMVRLLLSKRADPSVLATAGVDVKQLNITMQYWLDLSQKSPPISDEDVADLERTAPMHTMHELT